MFVVCVVQNKHDTRARTNTQHTPHIARTHFPTWAPQTRTHPAVRETTAGGFVVCAPESAHKIDTHACRRNQTTTKRLILDTYTAKQLKFCSDIEEWLFLESGSAIRAHQMMYADGGWSATSDNKSYWQTFVWMCSTWAPPDRMTRDYCATIVANVRRMCPFYMASFMWND